MRNISCTPLKAKNNNNNKRITLSDITGLFCVCVIQQFNGHVVFTL